MSDFKSLWNAFAYSFPVQLLLLNLKRNHVLLFCWLLLFAMVSGFFGKYLGIPYLFLDPEYLNKVNFISFFIMGIVIAGFSAAFHITSYINDGHRFNFIGIMARPFAKYSLNNSIIPFAFMIIYVVLIIRYQINNEFTTGWGIVTNIAGLLTGYCLMTFLLFLYFWFTNKDIFKYVVCKVDEKLKQNIKVTRAGAMKKLDIARKKQVRVDNYIDFNLKPQKTPDDQGFYDRGTILQVFDQNHFNLVIIELLVIVLIFLLGIFRDVPEFQLPAAASFVLLLTIFVMFAGAFSYWFGGWAVSTAIGLFLIVNFLAGEGLLSKKYKAFGLDYDITPVAYKFSEFPLHNNLANFERDRDSTIAILEKWRSKFAEDSPPKITFVCTSGGGQRASLWTLKTLQQADSTTNGRFFESTILITGASGGIIGASYFRELILRKKLGDLVHPYSKEHLRQISTDNLNPILFSFLVNDIFLGFRKFEYMGQFYNLDRGYSFEEQLNKNTNYLLDKPLMAYHMPERESLIPMMILGPTIMNDGRKLFISPHNVSYMDPSILWKGDYPNQKTTGIDFLRFFEDHEAQNLRFLSALRMSATFPYITPNITLPSDPPLEIMDAGISDNFGLSDAARFIYAFKDWISENTSGVVIVSIRDSEKQEEVTEESHRTIVQKFSQPISSIYRNFEGLQDINNDNIMEYARALLDIPVHRVDFQYIPSEEGQDDTLVSDSLKIESRYRASLSWRLTGKEKSSIIDNIRAPHNRLSIQRLDQLLKDQAILE